MASHTEIKEDWRICESKLYSKNGRFFVNITVEIEVEEVKSYWASSGLASD